MANIGLIDVDGHNFPNLALMRISAWHKSQGDSVNWWFGFEHYDILYMSKIFSDAYSKDVPEPVNAEKIIKGGTGYAIDLVDGKEVFDITKHPVLPAEVELMFPDYSIYPKYNFAVAMTSRGCPRGCQFCHVKDKEGRKSVKVANVSDFYAGQKEIQVLDPNITACNKKLELFEQYAETKAKVEFSQGLDIRMLTDKDIEALSRIKIKNVHFAWDNPKDELTEKFKHYAEVGKPMDNDKRYFGIVYVLTNFNSTMEENLYRIYTLRDLGYTPYVMIYDKPNAPREIRLLQRWCNNKIIFRTCPRFEDFDPRIA